MTTMTQEVTVAVTRDGDVPVRAEGLELIGEVSGSGYRHAPSLVRRADGQTFQLTRLLFQTLEAIDGVRDLGEVASAVSSASGRHVRGADVARLVDDKLRPLGLVKRPDGSEPELKRSNPLLALRFRWVVTNRRVTNAVTRPFAFLFHPWIVVPLVVAFFLVCRWVLFDQGLAAATYQAFDRPELLLAVFGLTVLSAGFHEFGHAAAARYGGATPGAMGVGLYLVWPAFYTDVSDSYRLGRGGRIRTDLGGVYFNAIFTLGAFGMWWLTGAEALLLIIPAQILQMVQQLTPLLRFDGYHILADLTGVPDLYQRIKPTLLGLLPHRWGRPESKVLKPWARAVVSLWVLLVVPILIASVVLMVLALPRVIGTAWKGLGKQTDALADAWSDVDVAAVGARVLLIVFLVIPVFGMIYIVVRLVRRVSEMLWRANPERPKRRLAAQATAIALLGGLSYAWWPAGDNYRPVQAYERGTLGDAFASAPATFGPGYEGATETVWAGADELPTRDRPTLAVVMRPKSGEGTTWVFPFNRPLPPGEGDNQALAVNTTDGTVVYEVAFALVWVRDGSATNRNEAYAFASCEGCAAVAVGFQVVLVVGEVDVAVPENLAGAVNYACVSCVTYALATQLVVTLPRELSDAANAELAALWEEIRLFGENIEGVPLAELESHLEGFKSRIVDVISRDLGMTPGAAPPDTTTATTAPSTTAVSATTVAASGTTTPAGAADEQVADPTVASTTASTSAPTSEPAAIGTSPATTTATASTSASPAPGTTTAPSPATTTNTGTVREPEPTTTSPATTESTTSPTTEPESTTTTTDPGTTTTTDPGSTTTTDPGSTTTAP
jgi:putative peptide zinc metalloprotease protein